MSYEFRRGMDAMQEAAERKPGGGNFRPFIPQLKWKDDKDEKYILFLTTLEETPTVQYHEFIPVGKGEKANGEEYTKYDEFIARIDPAIGEDYDDLLHRLDQNPKDKSIGVAVELEPVIESVKGRPKPVSFTVKTSTYERKNEDGSTEEVTQPEIGLIVQSPRNFWAWPRSYQETQGDVEEVPVQVIRVGSDANTTYQFYPFEEKPVDLTNLIDFIDGISYLNDHMDEIQEAISGMEQVEAARHIGRTLLDVRLDELADSERYAELVDPITEIESKFGAKPNGKKPKRPARPSSKDKTDNEAAPVSRTEKFNKLRDRVEK